MKNLGEALPANLQTNRIKIYPHKGTLTMEDITNTATLNAPAKMTASAITSVGTLSISQALHERICLLYLRLEGCPKAAESVSEFDLETGWGLNYRTDRKTVYERLIEALCAYEELTGGMVHPVEGRLNGIAL